MNLFSNRKSSKTPASCYCVEKPAVLAVCSSGSTKVVEEPVFSKPLKPNQYFNYLASDCFLEIIAGPCQYEGDLEDDIDLPMEHFYPDEPENDEHNSDLAA